MTSDPISAAEPISSVELVERILGVVDERRRQGALEPPPQPMFASDPVDAWEVYPWRRPRAGAPPLRAARSNFAAADLLALEDARFVVRAHHALLDRDPLPAELELWTRRVERDWPRSLVVAALHLSPEGRRGSVHVRGLVAASVRACLRYPLHQVAEWWYRR